MPDGRLAGEVARAVAVYPVAEACCPRCGSAVDSVVGPGVTLLRCRHFRSSSARCSQAFALFGFTGRLIIVAALSREEFESFRKSSLEPEVLMARLRILGVPLMPAA